MMYLASDDAEGMVLRVFHGENGDFYLSIFNSKKEKFNPFIHPTVKISTSGGKCPDEIRGTLFKALSYLSFNGDDEVKYENKIKK